MPYPAHWPTKDELRHVQREPYLKGPYPVKHGYIRYPMNEDGTYREELVYVLVTRRRTPEEQKAGTNPFEQINCEVGRTFIEVKKGEPHDEVFTRPADKKKLFLKEK